MYSVAFARVLMLWIIQACFTFGESTRCQVPSVSDGSIGKYETTILNGNLFQKINKGTVVNHGQKFIVKCDERFQIEGQRKGETNIVCQNGKWLPDIQCIPATSCAGDPPEVEHARHKRRRTRRGTSIVYRCHKGYFKAKRGIVTCQYGEWKGNVPVCKDRRCYLKDLIEKEGVQPTNTSTASGRLLDITCQNGYSYFVYGIPLCLKGTWQIQDAISPCQPSPCRVPDIENGTIQHPKINQRMSKGSIEVWKKEYLEPAKSGSLIKHGEEMFVTCEPPYIFNGTDDSEIVSIRCHKGKWIPHPQCLNETRNLEESNETGDALTEKIENNSSSNVDPEAAAIILLGGKTDRLNPSDIYNSDGIRFTEYVAVETSNSSDNYSGFHHNASIGHDNSNDKLRNDSCSCDYEIDDPTLNAYVGGELLHNGSQVRNGDTVKFRCRNIGYYQFIGTKQIRCLDCNWETFHFPECKEPDDYDAIIQVADDEQDGVIIVTDGVMMVMPGTELSLPCTTFYPYGCPQWKIRTLSGYVSRAGCTRTLWEGSEKFILTTLYVVHKAKESDSGKYECDVGYGEAHYIEVKVKDFLCPEIEEDDSVVVTYTDGRKIYSKANFTCSQSNSKLIGLHSIECQENGEWSSDPSVCELR